MLKVEILDSECLVSREQRYNVCYKLFNKRRHMQRGIINCSVALKEVALEWLLKNR